MGANKKRIPRQRLEELLWLQCAHIDGLTEKIQLLRKQNDLLRTANQQLREQVSPVPKVKRYPTTYAKKSAAKATPAATYRAPKVKTAKGGWAGATARFNLS